MLYLLLYPLQQYFSEVKGLRYEALCSVLAGLTAWAVSLALGPVLIYRFREMRIGQTIREVVPQAHQKKAGTPTMGGLLIVASMLAATLLLANILNPYVWIAVFVTLTFGAIGFSDDYFKLTRGKGLGLSGPAKLVWSFSCAFIAAAWLFLYLGFDTHLTVPFFKNAHPDLHAWLYIPFAMLVIGGCSHAVNLTDGLDGLAIGPVMTVAATYWVFTYVAGNIRLAGYLQIPYIPNVGEVAIFWMGVIAASLGFLWFNPFPASMMMGDVGALSLGGAIGTVAVLCKQELALVIAGGVFVAEAASTIIQRYYFKAKHSRYFLIAPSAYHLDSTVLPQHVCML